MTKMATISIYGKKQLLCPVTVLVDSQVSDLCPWATCFKILIPKKYKYRQVKTFLLCGLIIIIQSTIFQSLHDGVITLSMY